LLEFSEISSAIIIPSQKIIQLSIHSEPSSEIRLKGIPTLPFIPQLSFFSSSPSFHYKAATSASIPTAPPIPATKAGAAPDDVTGAGALELALPLAELEGGTLVVTAVTDVVLVEAVDRGVEDVLTTEEEPDEAVVVVEFRPAE